jgi:hypothetical protein
VSRKSRQPDWWPVSIQDPIDAILMRGPDRLITLIGSTIGARELVKAWRHSPVACA